MLILSSFITVGNPLLISVEETSRMALWNYMNALPIHERQWNRPIAREKFIGYPLLLLHLVPIPTMVIIHFGNAQIFQ